MGIEQHLVGLQQIGAHEEGPAIAELEVRHLAGLVRTPSIIAQSSLQSNWNASPGANGPSLV